MLVGEVCARQLGSDVVFIEEESWEERKKDLLLCCTKTACPSPAEEGTRQRCEGDDETNHGTVDCQSGTQFDLSKQSQSFWMVNLQWCRIAKGRP